MPTPQVKIPGISKILNEVKGAKRKNWSPLYGLAINGKIRFVIKRNGNQFKYSTVEVYEITKRWQDDCRALQKVPKQTQFAPL